MTVIVENRGPELVVTGADKRMRTGVVISCPSAQFGSHTRWKWVPVPEALWAVQLDQVMSFSPSPPSPHMMSMKPGSMARSQSPQVAAVGSPSR